MKFFTALTVNVVTIFTAQAAHVNQIGYYPFAKKVATVVDSSIDSFTILDLSSQKVAYRGAVTPKGKDNTSEEFVSAADFTPFNTEGDYRLIFDNKDTSYQFSISASCYKNALTTVMRSFFYLRSGISLPEPNAGNWYREAGHPGDSNLTVFDLPIDSSYDVRGGWYDAGDFGKYVVNAGITCGTLLELFELYPDLINDSSLNIPESGNKKSDLLDEIKYELDWLIRMQDSDGGVFFKVGPVEWYGTIMPANDRSERFIIGKSTTSTLNFAAVMAMAGRIYKEYNLTFAQNCIQRAEKAWLWALSNPSVAYPENRGGTGPYEDGSDKTFSDEFFWALSELSITTKKPVYLDTLEKIIFSKSVTGPAWWQDVKNMGFFSLAVNKTLSDSANLYIKTKLLAYADLILSNVQKSPYVIPMTARHYTWGSNGVCGNLGINLAYAHYLTKNQKYLDGLVYAADYIFGRNAMGYSYITGLGTRYPQTPHNRQSGADKIKEPVPGLVVGGANGSSDGADDFILEIIDMGTPAAKCYVDVYDSWSSNENSINQNAPWVLVLGYLQKNATDNHALSVNFNSMRKVQSTNSFYVNQNSNGIKIRFNADAGISVVKVYNLQGKCVMQRPLNRSDKTLFLTSKQTGSGSLIIAAQGDQSFEYQKVFLVK